MIHPRALSDWGKGIIVGKILEGMAQDSSPWFRLISASKRKYLDGLKRIKASDFAFNEVTAVDERDIRIRDQPMVDFATGCYLGLDFDIADEDVATVRKWGLRNGWSRASGTTPVTKRLEDEICRQTGLTACRLAASAGLINLTVFQSLRNAFPVVIADWDAHMTMKRGIRAAYGEPSKKDRYFKNNDLDALERLLAKYPRRMPKLVVIDGVYSMKGVRAPVDRIMQLCEKYNGYCYIDDAHGFGPLGKRGLGLIEEVQPKHLGRVFLVSAFAKGFSNPVGFIAFPQEFWYAVDGADCLTFCGPPSNFHSTVALRHLQALQSPAYEARRDRIRGYSLQLHAACAELGIQTFSDPGMPIIAVRIQPEHMETISAVLFSRGIYGKVAIYPVTCPGDEIVRFCVTALHTQQQIRQLCAALSDVAPFCVRDAAFEDREPAQGGSGDGLKPRRLLQGHRRASDSLPGKLPRRPTYAKKPGTVATPTSGGLDGLRAGPPASTVVPRQPVSGRQSMHWFF